MKRVLIIVGILIAAVAIVTIGMLLRDGTKTGPEDPLGSLPAGATLPIAGNEGVGPGTTGGSGAPGGAGEGLPIAGGGVSAVSQAAVIDYVINAEGVTFMASNGAVISASSTEVVGQADFADMIGAWFSPDGKWLLVRSGGGDASVWNLMDVSKKTWRNIQANTSEMVWSQAGSQLAYLARRTNGATLSTYSPATNSTKALLSLSAPDLVLRWRDASHILIMDRPSALVPGNILSFYTTGGTLTQFAANVSGAQILWGGADSGGLLFKAGPTGGTLGVVNSDGRVVQATNFLTLPSKCVFGESAPTSSIANISDYLFCSIPQNQALLKESQLPDDYIKGKFGGGDTLYAIDLLIGNLTPVIPASQSFNFDATNLKIYGDKLYFVNRNDQKLYRVPLSGLSLESLDEEGD